MNILDQLAEHARQRVEATKQTVPLAEAKRLEALALPKGDFRFEKKPLQSRALPSSASAKRHRPPRASSHRTSRICKLPKSTKLPVRDAISVLTEPKWFLGRGCLFKRDHFPPSPRPACARTLPWMNI